jgi:hypothetical protein
MKGRTIQSRRQRGPEAGAQRYTATVLNVSSGGLSLKLDTPQAFAAWGMGRVVRVDSTGTAIDLQAGTFD